MCVQKAYKMEKVHKMIKTLLKNKESLAAKMYSFEKRLEVIFNSKLTCNESVSIATNDIKVLSKESWKYYWYRWFEKADQQH